MAHSSRDPAWASSRYRQGLESDLQRRRCDFTGGQLPHPRRRCGSHCSLGASEHPAPAEPAQATTVGDRHSKHGGGQDTGIDLLRGFAKSAFTYQQPSIFNRLKLSPELKPFVQTYQGPVPDLPEVGFTRRADGRWDANPSATPRSHMPQEPFPGSYAGEVVILVDGGVGSAATMFAAKAQSLGRARIIGEPTGGSRLGPTAGTVLFATLPHSGVVLTVPVIRQVMHSPLQGADGGVVPDTIVRTTIEDVLSGRDRVLEAALLRE